MTPLVFRGVSPLVGLERTRDVRRRFADRRPSAAAASWSQAPPDWLRSWTLDGRVRCGDGPQTKLGADLDASGREDLRITFPMGLLIIAGAFAFASRHAT